MPAVLVESIPFAIIPTITILGPLAFLAWLFPVVVGGLALVARRWRVLFATAGACSALYLSQVWLPAPRYGWIMLGLAALAGFVWSWIRHRAVDEVTVPSVATRPGRGELIVLTLASLAALTLTLSRWGHGALLFPPWKDVLPVCAAVWAGTLYAAGVRFLPADQLPRRNLPRTSEPVILATLAVACVVMGAIQAPPPGAAEASVVWMFEAQERGAVVSTPLVAGERVYVSAVHIVGFSQGGAVYCLERDSGKVVWRFDNGGRMLPTYSSPCLADGRLYVGEGMHAHLVCQFYCLDAAVGRKLWQFETAGHIESSPCVANGKVYFGAGDDGLYCLDAVTGAERWHFQGPYHIDTSPAVAGRRLYAGSGVSRRWQDTEIFCLDAEGGQVLWREKTELPVWASPALSGGEVFFGLGNGRLDKSAQTPAGAVLCVDGSSGRLLWRFPVEDAVVARPAVDADRVYFGARDGNGYCLDRHAGTLIWTAPLGSPVVTQPALDAACVYMVASGGQVSCLEAESGKLVWSFDVAPYTQTSPLLYSSPVVADRPGIGGGRQILFGAELQGALSSAAALFCVTDSLDRKRGRDP